MKEKIKPIITYLLFFVRWLALSLLVGGITGGIGSLFRWLIELVTDFRMRNPYIIYFLPLAGVIIVLIYKLFKLKNHIGTNDVLLTARGDSTIPGTLIPAIISSTVLTHLFGGSAGKEGAALQLGGSVASVIGRVFKLDNKDMSIIVICGMSGVFTALFGTPVTATIFAIEVVSVGIMYYSALVPALFSSVTALIFSKLVGLHPESFSVTSIPEFQVTVFLKVFALAILCAVVSILFCFSMKMSHKYLPKLVKNEYLLAIFGGVVIVLLTKLVGSTDYNGGGMHIVEMALEGTTRPEAFILKILFTAVTIGSGFKGGEIVPTFFIGSTFGCFAASFLGLDPSFAAAIGLVSLFCSVVNCPITSIILSIELFGVEGFIYFVLACAISYVFSGYFGLYSEQKIVYSKVRTVFIDKNTH